MEVVSALMDNGIQASLGRKMCNQISPTIGPIHSTVHLLPSTHTHLGGWVAGLEGVGSIFMRAPQLMLCKPTTNDRWDRRAVELAYTDSILFSLPIATTAPGGGYVVELTVAVRA